VASRLNPYISFSDNARQAMEFYKTVFGGTLVLNTFGEYGPPDSGFADKDHARHAETPGGYNHHGRGHPAWDEPQAGRQHQPSA